MLEDVLADDDAHIDHGADGDGNAGESDYVGVNAKDLHRGETGEHGQRQQPGDQHGSAQIHHQRQHHDHRYQHLLAQGALQRAQRLLNQARSVVKRDHLHLADPPVGQSFPRQARGDFRDLGLDAFNSCQRIGTIARHHHAADYLRTFLVQRTAPQRRS